MFIPDPTFFHPGSELFPSRIRIKDFKYFNPKKWFLSSMKYDPGCSSRIPDPGVKNKKTPDPGSATLWITLDRPSRPGNQAIEPAGLITILIP
jgi:hypothetical protein